MKKISLLLVIMISHYATSKAQIIVSMGGSFGLSTTKYNGNGSRFGDDGWISYGLAYQGYAEVPKTKGKLLAAPRLGFVRHSYEADQLSVGTVSVGYINFSLPILYHGYIGNKKDLHLYAGLGPYVAGAISGNYKPVLTGTGPDKVKMKFGNTVSDNRQGSDFGIVTKIGCGFNILDVGIELYSGKKNVIPKELQNSNKRQLLNTQVYANLLLGSFGGKKKK